MFPTLDPVVLSTPVNRSLTRTITLGEVEVQSSVSLGFSRGVVEDGDGVRRTDYASHFENTRNLTTNNVGITTPSLSSNPTNGGLFSCTLRGGVGSYTATIGSRGIANTVPLYDNKGNESTAVTRTDREVVYTIRVNSRYKYWTFTTNRAPGDTTPPSETEVLGASNRGTLTGNVSFNFTTDNNNMIVVAIPNSMTISKSQNVNTNEVLQFTRGDEFVIESADARFSAPVSLRYRIWYLLTTLPLGGNVISFTFSGSINNN